MLLTAFRPFGGRKNNTSLDVAQNIISRLREERGSDLDFANLPVNFATTWQVCRAMIARAKPPAIILLGEKKSGRLTLESTARNLRGKSGGLIPILKKGPQKILSPVASGLYQKLSSSQRKFWELSNDAGTYLCNYAYYRTLLIHRETPCVFIHVPALNPEQHTEIKIFADRILEVIALL